MLPLNLRRAVIVWKLLTVFILLDGPEVHGWGGQKEGNRKGDNVALISSLPKLWETKREISRVPIIMGITTPFLRVCPF